MEISEFKHVIALLLEDVKRLQQLEPNAGTEARIFLAQKSINSEVCETIGEFAPSKITPLKCDGISKVYHETMVKALKLEIEGLNNKLGSSQGLIP